MRREVELNPLNLNDPDHIGWMFKVRTHHEVARYMYGKPPATFLQHTQYLYEVRHKQFFIIQSQNNFLGYCQSTQLDGEIELGWAVHPMYWGQGIGSMSVDLLVQKSISYQKKIILFVKKDNLRALHLYEKQRFIIDQSFKNLEQYKMIYDHKT